MKKLFSVIVSIAIFMSVIFCVPFVAQAGVTRLGDTDTFYSYDSSTKTLTISGEGDMPNYLNSDSEIPWFYDLDNIDTVVVEEGVTSIGSFALYNCVAKNISLPSTLKSIGSYGMASIRNIYELELPFGFSSIGSYGLSSCIRLKSIDLPTTLTSIGNRAFEGCTALNSITIPYSVRSIGMYCFRLCENLQNVAFQSMTSSITIAAYAFLGCNSLKSLDVPLNAVCNNSFFGYDASKVQYSYADLGVYANSNAHNYAISKGIKYHILDEIPVGLGVPLDNTYTNDNIATEYHYSFVADSDMDYCIYTTGEIDVRARMLVDGKQVAQCEDISANNRNILFTYSCKAGVKYDVYLSSVNYRGKYSLIALPMDITSFSIDASCSVSAADGVAMDNDLYFVFDNSILDGKLFCVEYANGFVHRFFYNNSFYDAKDISVASDVALDCGNNALPVYIGDAVSSIDAFVDHSYTTTVVQPTPDEDGHTLHKCINCDDSFKTDFFATDRIVYTLSGKCVLSENRFGYHSIDVPYNNAEITVGNRKYSIADDGSWTIRTFGDCYVVFNNFYGMNDTIRYTVDADNPNKDYGVIALEGYDLNNDGYVNARDYIILKKDKKDMFNDDYWQFANNFLTTH